MKTLKFQIESADQLSTTMIAEKSSEIIKLESFQASLESLVLGYRLRGWLTDSEKQILDCLAPNHHICFLLEGEKYLHPTDCELFSYDTIRSSQSMPGEAIFQHRWEPDGKSDRGAYSIHSTQINPNGNIPVTIGLFGPEVDEFSSQLKERFCQLAEMARWAWRESTLAIDAINKRFTAEKPFILVNRCSGRVLHASQTVLEMFDITAEQIIDLEFSQAGKILTNVFKDNRFKMTRFTIGQFMFGSIELISFNQNESINEAELEANLIHKLKNKLTSIMSASGYLISGASENEITEIGQMIQSEARLSDKIISRMLLLQNWDRSTPIETNLRKALDEAKTSLEHETNYEFNLKVDAVATDLIVKAPSTALKTLIETVVLSHVGLGATKARLKITDSTDGKILVFSSAVAHSSLSEANLWADYSNKLAKLLNVRLTTSHEPTTGAITTLEFSAACRTIE